MMLARWGASPMNHAFIAASLMPPPWTPMLSLPVAKVTGEVEGPAVGMRDVALCRHSCRLPRGDAGQAGVPLQRREAGGLAVLVDQPPLAGANGDMGWRR